ncbi:type II secretory pathway, pseudopilin PulG [Clostridium aceticum]|uniref:Type II secretory pathway, pseudopilin PulG n=1 Tax=Clostridium aceticum TaxID=84022 RepID=A0A0D8IBM9_9CLOT|nr:prepilin-type N-terminal cleavage/methylation domain-containing protein [Clostridium aceticum]AKL96219.1 type II secretory pathway, pseudopilin PulG [Clostridium aceticum]KJF26631.1 hypothetical protein TZ02_12225 [Clostridium aceticum]
MKKKKSGFTLIECVVSIVIISIISVVMFKFSTNFSERMHDMSVRSEAIKIEYQDVLKVRTSYSNESPNVIKDKLNFSSKFYIVPEMTTAEREVWKYEGQYMETYKMFE